MVFTVSSEVLFRRNHFLQSGCLCKLARLFAVPQASSWNSSESFGSSLSGSSSDQGCNVKAQVKPNLFQAVYSRNNPLSSRVRNSNTRPHGLIQCASLVSNYGPNSEHYLCETISFIPSLAPRPYNSLLRCHVASHRSKYASLSPSVTWTVLDWWVPKASTVEITALQPFLRPVNLRKDPQSATLYHDARSQTQKAVP